MRKQQGQRLGSDAWYVQEVQLDALNWRGVLGKVVQAGFLSTPVEAVLPVGDQLLQVREVGAELPRCAVGRLIRPADTLKPLLQVIQRAVGDVQREWFGTRRGYRSAPRGSSTPYTSKTCVERVPSASQCGSRRTARPSSITDMA